MAKIKGLDEALAAYKFRLRHPGWIYVKPNPEPLTYNDILKAIKKLEDKR